MVKNLPAMQETWVNSCLENSVGRGAWQVTVHEILKSQTMTERLAHIHPPTHTHTPHTHTQNVCMMMKFDGARIRSKTAVGDDHLGLGE